MKTRRALLLLAARVSIAGAVVFSTAQVARAADPPANSAAPGGLDEKFLDEHFGSERARAFAKNFPMRGELGDLTTPPRTPQESVASFKLMAGLKADAVLSEPGITQPVFLNFDERGRIWVVQFIQYPYPAGLKIVDLGGQFHAKYDKTPPPPPNHFRGADKITIHEDADGDGVFESRKVFVEGLNMVTSVERGRGGVWVLNPPYLLFYPDANNDDVPDGDPVVHLAGFGLEDTHSIASSLQWGPDGWLWGVQGSGVTAKVRRPGIDAEGAGIAFQGQAVWRYQPERRVFEIFAEGGGNPFSLSIDSQGRVFAGSNNPNLRGYQYEQGSYYRKSWGEHGYLTNPYAFGFFEGMPHNWRSSRFTQTQLVYEEGGLLGPMFEGHFIAANALQHCIYLTERIQTGSTYSTRDLSTILESDDRWFRPVDIKAGPDGAVYVADWYDSRLSHMDPRDNWDKNRGRIYRIRAADTKPGMPSFDLSKKSSSDLVALLGRRQQWFRRTALRLLADRKDQTVIGQLLELARKPDNPHALDALLALHVTGGFSMENAGDFVRHPQASVRTWAVRLLGDEDRAMGAPLKEALAQMARTEPDVQARCQLAATARRLRSDVALPVIFALMERSQDIEDSSWGLCGLGLLPADVRMRDALHAQDCLYTLVERSPAGDTARVVGSIVEFLFAPDNREAVLEKMAAPQTRIVSLTITEAGYYQHAGTGDFDAAHPDIRHDLENPHAPACSFGYLAEALNRRRRRGQAPFTVMSCDNIQGNGDIARRMLLAFAELRGPALAQWMASHVAFPNSMVDRITPATTDEHRTLVREKFGIVDGWPVMAESFKQWVIEDHFVQGRPAWEKVGAQLTTNVLPYEKMKLRLLNASHQALCYIGLLFGYEFAHQTMEDADIRRLVELLMDREVTPLLPDVPGVNLSDYKRTLVERFGNPAICDQLSRIGMYGSSGMPKFVLPSVQEQLARGGPVKLLGFVVACWFRYLEGTDERGHAISFRDPMAPRLHHIAKSAAGDPRPLLAVHEVFGADLAASPTFVAQVAAYLRSFHTHGARVTLELAIAG